jgi:hypothetical protein
VEYLWLFFGVCAYFFLGGFVIGILAHWRGWWLLNDDLESLLCWLWPIVLVWTLIGAASVWVADSTHDFLRFRKKE